MRPISAALVLVGLITAGTGPAVAQDGWEWQNPLPQGSDINCVQFLDSQNGWMVPTGPTLFRTRDGGESWQYEFIDFYLKATQFLTPSMGWAIGRQISSDPADHVYRTNDGGKTWQQVFDETVDFHLFFLDSLKGWVTDGQWLFHTPDGGQTWIKQAENPIRCCWGSTDLDGVYFKDGGVRGWAYAGSWAIETRDGGESWVRQDTLIGTFKMVFVDSMQGWVAKLREIWSTEDGGETWRHLHTFVPQNNEHRIQDFVVVNRRELIFSSEEGLYGSTDGGQSWQQYSAQPLGQMAFGDSLTAWAVGPHFAYDPAQYYTIDGGRTWERRLHNIFATTSVWFRDLDFVNDETGWVIGNGGDMGQEEYMIKTIDGGQSWTHLTVPGTGELSRVQFLNEQVGWVIGDSGAVFNSIDGGESWTTRSLDANVSLSAVHFFDADHGWLVGCDFNLSKGFVWKTTDGGQNWIEVSPEALRYATGGAFIDTLRGWVVTGGGRNVDVGSIWYTDDGGVTWQQQLEDTPFLYFNAIANGDDNTAWATGYGVFEGGLIYSTKDGGLTWTPRTFDQFSPLDIAVADRESVWLVGLLGNILSTADGGETWLSTRSLLLSALNAVDFVDRDTGWAAGTWAVILHRNQNATAITERQYDLQAPETFRLLPNYPNPFVQKTRISFDLLRAAAQAQITFYNVLGQEVRTIVYQASHAGRHNITWDGRDNLGQLSPSGLYLYRLRVDNEVQTGRMLLMR